MEIIKIKGTAFQPLKDYNGWRIAQLGYLENINSLHGIKTLGRHFKTDEVFVLIEGDVRIYTAGIKDDLENIDIKKLEKGNLYVVKEKQWHVAVLEPGARVLIIENKNTSDENSDNYILNQADKERMQTLYNISSK